MTVQRHVLAAPKGAPGRAARLRYETAILGIAAFIVPPLLVASLVAIGGLAGAPGRFLTAAVEIGVPLATGIAAAALLAGESALELQLTVPGAFRPAALRRLAVLVAWAGAVSLLAVGLGRATGVLASWPGATSPVEDLLMPLSPLAGFATWGALLGIALRSRGAAAAAITSFWLAALAWKDLFLAEGPLRAWYPFMFTFEPHASDVVATRLTLLGLAAAGGAILVAWLGRSEWLLGSEER